MFRFVHTLFDEDTGEQIRLRPAQNVIPYGAGTNLRSREQGLRSRHEQKNEAPH